MDKDAFRATLDRLQLKPDEAARLIGVSRRAVYRYLDGSRAVPPAVVSYLRVYEGLDELHKGAERTLAGVK